jgi:DNA-binding transcriptional LysR family regulator
VKNSNRKFQRISRGFSGNQINWNQVFYFSEIAGAGSIKVAAEKLGLTASTLSIHLSQLESNLEVQLFHRKHRKLNLTVEGSRLYHHAKGMFEAGQRLIDVVSPMPLGCYPVSVALVPSLSLRIANRILGRYLQSQPFLNMKIYSVSYDELEKGLAEARYDFGFSDRIPSRKDVRQVRASQAAVNFYVAPRLSHKPFGELIKSLPLLICSADPSQRSLVEQVLLDADLAPSSVVTSDYPSTLFDLCLQGVGIGVFSEVPKGQLANKGLSALQVPKGAPKLKDNLFCLWAESAENTEAIELLVDTLAKVAD